MIISVYAKDEFFYLFFAVSWQALFSSLILYLNRRRIEDSVRSQIFLLSLVVVSILAYLHNSYILETCKNAANFTNFSREKLGLMCCFLVELTYVPSIYTHLICFQDIFGNKLLRLTYLDTSKKLSNMYTCTKNLSISWFFCVLLPVCCSVWLLVRFRM